MMYNFIMSETENSFYVFNFKIITHCYWETAFCRQKCNMFLLPSLLSVDSLLINLRIFYISYFKKMEADD